MDWAFLNFGEPGDINKYSSLGESRYMTKLERRKDGAWKVTFSSGTETIVYVVYRWEQIGKLNEAISRHPDFSFYINTNSERLLDTKEECRLSDLSAEYYVEDDKPHSALLFGRYCEKKKARLIAAYEAANPERRY